MSKPKYKKHKNVFRIETGNTRGWQVRIERNKEAHSRLFSDSLHGGTDGALEAALAWRDAKLEELPDYETPTAHLHTPEVRRKAAEAVNRTGVIGIGFSMYAQKNGEPAPYVTCHWRDPESGRRKSSSYSVNKHGLRGALRVAAHRLRTGRGEDPTRGQVEYYVNKAYPAVKYLYEEAMRKKKSKRKGRKSRKRATS